MPRNASGTYTLPESAFVAGTTIQSAPMNSNLSDIGTALTQSLAITGVSTMTGPIKAASGSVTAPSYTFSGATGTGFYLSGTNEFSWTAAGVLAATFAASGAVTWVGAQTFQSTVAITGALTLSAALSLTNALSIVTGSEPALTIRNSDNDASEHELTRYALGDGTGATASRRILGAGANDVTQIRDYIGSTEILRQTASLVSPKKNLSIDAGITVIATAGYCDLTEIAAPASPSANIGRLYVRDASGTTIVAYVDSAGAETILAPPSRNYAEYATATTITTTITFDDSIPQNTEGDEILTAAITLKKSNSRVRITFQGYGACSSTAGDDLAEWAAALFVDTTADALAAVAAGPIANNVTSSDNVGVSTAVLVHEYAPGSVGPFTYKIRVGPSDKNAGNELFMNGSDQTRLFGGVSKATLVVEEIYV